MRKECVFFCLGGQWSFHMSPHRYTALLTITIFRPPSSASICLRDPQTFEKTLENGGFIKVQQNIPKHHKTSPTSAVLNPFSFAQVASTGAVGSNRTRAAWRCSLLAAGAFWKQTVGDWDPKRERSQNTLVEGQNINIKTQTLRSQSSFFFLTHGRKATCGRP